MAKVAKKRVPVIAGTVILPPNPEPTPERIRDISELVYRERLGSSDLASMLEKDGADKVRQRAQSYDALTRAYFRALNITS